MEKTKYEHTVTPIAHNSELTHLFGAVASKRTKSSRLREIRYPKVSKINIKTKREHTRMTKFLFMSNENETEGSDLAFFISETAKSRERNINRTPDKKGINPDPGLVGSPNPNLTDAMATIIPTISQKRIAIFSLNAIYLQSPISLM
jgi:hypothetical protein